MNAYTYTSHINIHTHTQKIKHTHRHIDTHTRTRTHTHRQTYTNTRTYIVSKCKDKNVLIDKTSRHLYIRQDFKFLPGTNTLAYHYNEENSTESNFLSLQNINTI